MTPEVKAIVRKLRPPFSRNAKLVFGFALEGRLNYGYTVTMDTATEPVACPGDGMVESVVLTFPDWQYSSTSDHRTRATLRITIDHGFSVKSVIAGIAPQANVVPGQSVQRGDMLGSSANGEIFFAFQILGHWLNPNALNRYFAVYDGQYVIGQGRKIRYAPDRIIRDLSASLAQTIRNGIRYFANIFGQTFFLVNIDFNGNGTKVGLAADGISASDYWNVYTPQAFAEVYDYACYYTYYGKTFTADAALFLRDYRNVKSPVWLERIAPLTADAGSYASFDTMLQTYIGGYDGFLIPFSNTFRLRGIPAGGYNLYLYSDATASGNASDFYVNVNSDTPTLLQNTPTGATSFVKDDNYVVQKLVLVTGDIVTINVIGFWSGLQLKRL